MEKDQVIQALRATLISVKGALTLKQCNRDYRELQGEWIPFKKLGYQTLEQLFLDVPGFKVTQVNGEWLVDAIASQETQHIAAMVSRQKSSKKPLKSFVNRFPKKQGSWRKPAPTNYVPNYDSQYSKQYYRAKGGTPYYNNNYSNNKYSKKPYESKGYQPYNKITTKPANDQNERIPSKNNNYTAVPPPASVVKKEAPPNESTMPPPPPKIEPEKKEPKQSSKVSASQRLSNLRERLNTVENENMRIPLHLPASNDFVESSGPVFHVAQAYNLEPPPENISSVDKLEWTCRKLGLSEPVYKVHDIRPKRGPVIYDCTVKVGTSYSASSYPDSSPSEDLAKEVAAVKLLSIIESSEAGGLPTSSNSKAISNLADLVAEHEAGLWANTVPHLYREKYRENLPSNWQELIENCPRIIKDRVVNGLLVLLPNNEESSIPYFEPSAALDDGLESELPALCFPENDFWNVFVTVANSTLEIWIRIIGSEYSDAFESLLADMASYYDFSGTCVDKSMLIKNGWYAVNLEEGGWHRAKIMEIEEETVTVFLGDHGDDDMVSVHQIKILEPQFRKLPAQAILCRLEGAEELAASEAGAAVVRRRLPGEVLVAAPGPRADPTDPAVGVVLYDTSTHRDLNLNKELVNDFCMAGAFTVTQKPCEVQVGCVTEEGRVWVSRAGGGALVRDALALLTAGPYRRPLPAAPRAPPAAPHTLYIVRTLAGDWVRCIVISGLDGEGTVRTQLVDSGLLLRAPLSSLVPLAAFSPTLNTYPHQAMQVRLGGAERAAPAMVGRLREMLLDTRVLCRALPASSPGAGAGSSVPAVELFVRTGPQNILASVNNAVLMEYEYLNHDKPKEEEEKETLNPLEALSRKKELIFGSSAKSAAAAGGAGGAGGGALPPPALPAAGKCFDVYIAMAANPWNFVVQPNSTRHTLQTMMATLQAECPKIPESEAPASAASGELYTVLYDKDSTWYRVTVAGAVSTEMVSVYFCDFGDLALVARAALRPLPPAAPLARSLPPQAVKARLYDVWPLHQDWTVEDCIRFQELCVEQQFVGICQEVGKDPLNPNEPLLILDLVDTSTDEDIYLNKQLVAEGRARLASAAAST